MAGRASLCSMVHLEREIYGYLWRRSCLYRILCFFSWKVSLNGWHTLLPSQPFFLWSFSTHCTCIANLIGSFSIFCFFLFFKSLNTSNIRFSKFNNLQFLIQKKKKKKPSFFILISYLILVVQELKSNSLVHRWRCGVYFLWVTKVMQQFKGIKIRTASLLYDICSFFLQILNH